MKVRNGFVSNSSSSSFIIFSDRLKPNKDEYDNYDLEYLKEEIGEEYESMNWKEYNVEYDAIDSVEKILTDLGLKYIMIE